MKTITHSLSELRDIERGYEFCLCEQLLAEPRDMKRIELNVSDLRRIRTEIEAARAELMAGDDSSRKDSPQ